MDKTSAAWDMPIPCPSEEGYYTYILRCADDTLYTGWTNRLDHRLQMHNLGQGCKYTHRRIPVTLVYYESSESRGQAMSRECQIKKLSRKQKLQLISAHKAEFVLRSDRMND